MVDPLAQRLKSAGRVHFIGIGGIGMAGLARLLMQAGFEVSGSDAQPNRLTRALKAEGIRIYEGHHPDHVRDCPDWAVRTPALGEGNPELDHLRARQIPVFSRGQVLAAYSRQRDAIAVAGAHGKTTTTAMLASILFQQANPCGYAVGGETHLPGSVADAGDGKTLVLEADESDGTLVHYAPRVGVLTHVEWDHVERFRSEAALLRCYRKFVERCGEVWIREDDLQAQKVTRDHPRVFRVGRSPAAELQLTECRQHPDGQEVSFLFDGQTYDFHLKLPGIHNAWNALMALAAAQRSGMDLTAACDALSNFKGVARRFQIVEHEGVRLIHDYAHHPTEIRAVITSAQALQPQRLRLVFQPHRFSRTRHLLDDFVAAFSSVDDLALLPVYAASEHSHQGVGSALLAEKCLHSHPGVKVYPDHQSLIREWTPQLISGEVVLLVGAGDIESLQSEMLQILQQG